MKINVKDYGAKGDGVTDDVAAFQAAEDTVSTAGGGTIIVPAGTYIVSEPFFHRSFVTLIGVGDTSIIKNTVAVQNGDDQFCIHIGNFDPSTFGECLHFNIKSVVANARRVRMTTISEAARFSVGDIVLIDSTDGFISTDDQFKPYVALINKIIAVDLSTGNITLEDPIPVSIPSGKIALTDEWIDGTNNTVDKVYVCERPIIKNIRFESLGNWTLRWGCYKGIFKSISIKSTDIIGANGLSHCKFTNITGEFSQKVIELAMYSHHTTVDGLNVTWWNGVIDPANKPLIKMGENVRSCLYTNMTIDSTGGGSHYNACISYGHAFYNKISGNNKFICPNVLGAAVEHATPDPLSKVIGNETRYNSFEMGSGSNYISFDNGDSGSDMSANIVTDDTFSGTISGQQVKLIGTVSNNVYVPNTYL